MSKFDKNQLSKSEAMIQDCIAAADIAELREIDAVLDSLKDIIDENILSMAGQCGDY